MRRCQEIGCTEDALVAVNERHLCGRHFAEALREIRRSADQLRRLLIR